jgi:hypothetical protein
LKSDFSLESAQTLLISLVHALAKIDTCHTATFLDQFLGDTTDSRPGFQNCRFLKVFVDESQYGVNVTSRFFLNPVEGIPNAHNSQVPMFRCPKIPFIKDSVLPPFVANGVDGA